MMRIQTVAKVITTMILFIGVFCLIAKLGIYVAFVAAFVVTARIIKNLS